MSAPILPDLDVWLKALSRHHPDPLVVHAFATHLTDRRLHLLGWIRQGLLARVADERQSLRLHSALSAFPDLRVLTDDHVRAARLARRLRAEGHALGPWHALMWSIATRIGGVVWSLDRRWRALGARGAPLWAPEPR